MFDVDGESMKEYMIAYVLIINLITFYFYWNDKQKAKKGKWRIPENTLLLLAFAGGSIGAMLAMKLFRHKTKHWKFRILVPLFFVLQIFLVGYFK